MSTILTNTIFSICTECQDRHGTCQDRHGTCQDVCDDIDNIVGARDNILEIESAIYRARGFTPATGIVKESLDRIHDA